MTEIETILWELVQEYRISSVIVPPSEYEHKFVRTFVTRVYDAVISDQGDS